MDEAVVLSQEEKNNLRRSTKKQKHVRLSLNLIEELFLIRIYVWAPPSPQVDHEDDDGVDEGYSYSSDSEEDDSDLQDFLAKRDPLCPIDKITKREKKNLAIPWKRAIIVKLLRKKIGLKLLQSRLSKLWQPFSSMDIIDLENDYFLIHFVWIRIPGLPVEYYDRQILWRIDSDPPKVDVANDVVNAAKENPVHNAVGKEDAAMEEEFGPWMLVQKGGRRSQSGNVSNAAKVAYVNSRTTPIRDKKSQWIEIFHFGVMVPRQHNSPNDGAKSKERDVAHSLIKKAKIPVKTVFAASNSRKPICLVAVDNLVNDKVKTPPSQPPLNIQRSQPLDDSRFKKKERNQGACGNAPKISHDF
ncbi:hypothetical protein SESBI_03587 [Sesbania bispinosa]|nr:hypothetical protein SESBI_03587 [Sesbania bispinosa]